MATTIKLHLTLPDDLAQEAKVWGLLEPGFLRGLLREEVRKRRIDRLFKAADSLAELPEPPMTAAEVSAEIEGVRKGRRPVRAHAGRS